MKYALSVISSCYEDVQYVANIFFPVILPSAAGLVAAGIVFFDSSDPLKANFFYKPVAFPFISGVTAMIASKSQYNLMEQVYGKALVILPFIELSSIAYVYKKGTYSYKKAEKIKSGIVFEAAAKFVKNILIDLGYVVPKMKQVSEKIVSPKMAIGDKLYDIGIAELEVVGVSWVADIVIDQAMNYIA